MNVLLVSPPANQGYINLCYRYVELGEVAGYLRERGHRVTVIDGLVTQGYAWTNEFEEQAHHTDALVLHHSSENVAEVLTAAEVAKRWRPDLQSVTYGIVGTFSAEPFLKSLLDAVIVSGDWEVVLAEWLAYIGTGCSAPMPGGVLVQATGKWQGKGIEQRVAAESWALPALDLLPLDGYRQQYAGSKTIAGYKASFELSFSVSRGCPYDCWFCPSGEVDGRADRRRPIKQVIDFLRDAVPRWGFNQFAPFSACFTLSRDWVMEFCGAIKSGGPHIAWRCVTTMRDTDLPLLSEMADAGCRRVGVGIETLNPVLLKKIGKPVDLAQLSQFIQQCHSLGITPLCFLLDGLPGQAPDEAHRDADTLRSMGANVRISKLINYHMAKKYPADDLDNHLARQVEFLHAGES